MATLEEEFAAYKQLGPAQREFQQWKARQAHEAEIAAGGAIRPAPPEQNFPIGATIGGVTGAVIGGLSPVPGGATIGGVVGTLGGEAIQQGVETVMGSEAAPQSLGQSAQRLA